MGMNFKEYQDKAWAFAVPTAMNFQYVLNGFIGEVGEYYGKMAKFTRDGTDEDIPALESGLKKELGDIVWFVAAIATMNGWDLQEIAEGNIKKLQARKEFGTIQGSGDNR